MALVAAPATATRRSAPLGPGECIRALDIIRGFALFGMILVHFHQKMRVHASGVEDLIPWAVIAGWMAFGLVSWALAWIALMESGFGVIEDQWLRFTYVGGIVLPLAYRPAWTSRLRSSDWRAACR